MPPKTNRASQSSEALKVARLKKTVFLSIWRILQQSEWRQCTTNEILIRKRTTCEQNRSIVQKKKKQFPKNVGKSNTSAMTSTCKAVLLAKAMGAAEYIIEKEKVLSNEKAGEIASKFHIGSGRTLRRFLKRTDSEMTIELYVDCIRSGRPVEITSEYLKSAFLKYISSRRYYVTIRSVTSWLKTLRTTACTDWAAKLLSSVGCRRVRVKIEPKIEYKYILKRFIYCWERLNEFFKARTTNDSTSAVDVFVDEKWFDKVNMGEYMWLPDSISIEQAA